jgi:hypothetical protein
MGIRMLAMLSDVPNVQIETIHALRRYMGWIFGLNSPINIETMLLALSREIGRTFR